jgi:hypothetical protein
MFMAYVMFVAYVIGLCHVCGLRHGLRHVNGLRHGWAVDIHINQDIDTGVVDSLSDKSQPRS